MCDMAGVCNKQAYKNIGRNAFVSTEQIEANKETKPRKKRLEIVRKKREREVTTTTNVKKKTMITADHGETDQMFQV
jgi:bisphosphoglycerate-independent phosphoglycerate mutase (AlkP superfamily)